ncbi:hypothetical protein AI2848V1_1579 [Klebsiella pneumoniae]|uniref:phage holin family protein n=1 Tax=Klebsiella quasipneumoniae TaxID=1463165 RepID=UPI001BA89163|nr:phage holin family protein [Klebsiella quasipneumoniae]CAF2452779.1 hypothetical protein AI2848V1_1579 [Klebsiella pneumoniae]HCD1310654.1 phage holin family protein [Klebsiella pneumoniae subsp. pneumoniae]HCI6537795.1 phage holin family protein [Klebsiella variicola subsp. variicola]HCM5205971.1 phage holin family protein [Klebsiella quasipneumoniae subsp. similipneumoniae]MBS3683406.1 phage holin family protein [Klebsiella quasipneumoniae]
MSDPLTGTGLIFGGGLIGSVIYGVITHTDFGVVFGAFGGAVFYVATTANLTRGRQIAYFMTSFIVGVLAAGLLGSKFTTWTGYTDRPLDALGAVVASAVTIKVLTFINSQDLSSLFGLLSRLRGGGSNGNK